MGVILKECCTLKVASRRFSGSACFGVKTGETQEYVNKEIKTLHKTALYQNTACQKKKK